MDDSTYTTILYLTSRGTPFLTESFAFICALSKKRLNTKVHLAKTFGNKLRFALYLSAFFFWVRQMVTVRKSSTQRKWEGIKSEYQNCILNSSFSTTKLFCC